VNVLEIVITTINLRIGRQGIYFSFRGWGGCDWCKSYHEIFSPSGKSIYLLIEDKTKIYRQFGNYENVIKRENISNKITQQEKFL
jgi:hypothetical protein